MPALPYSALSGYLVEVGKLHPNVEDKSPLYHAALAQTLAEEGAKTPTRYLGINSASEANWSIDRREVGLSQIILRSLGFYDGMIDGLAGPGTLHGIEQWQNYIRDVHENRPSSGPRIVWPVYANIETFFGKPGENLVAMNLPYQMRLAWDVQTPITRIQINKRCVESAQTVLEQVLQDYGINTLRDLGLDLFGGCFNDRNMRGGTKKSVHAYGAAIDFDPEHNQLRWGKDRAKFAQPVYNKWWSRWEAAGWVSLGRSRNYDWQHIQACQP